MGTVAEKLRSLSKALQIYSLQENPKKLVQTGRLEKLHSLLTDFDFIEAKVLNLDIQSLIADYDNIEQIYGEKEHSNHLINLKLIQATLQQSAQIINQDKSQIAGQLIGRLLNSDSPEIQKIIEETKQWKATNWLCPLTPSLNTSDSYQLGSLTGHKENINAIVITPDETRAISASDDGTLKVWNLDSRTELFTLSGHKGRIISVVLLPDGKRVISASADATLKIWSIEEKGEARQTFCAAIPATPEPTESPWLNNPNEGITAMTVTPDGKCAIVALFNEKTLRVWDLETNEQKFTLHRATDWINALAITPNGKRLISASDFFEKSLKVFALESGKELFTLVGHSRAIRAVAIAPDGQKLISASEDTTLKIWDLETMELLHTLSGHTDAVNSVVITPDGQRAISGSSDGTVRIWDIQNGQELDNLGGNKLTNISAVAIAQKKQLVIFAEDNILKICSLENQAKSISKLDQQGHTKATTAVAVTRDGKKAISGSDDRTLIVWNLDTGEILHTLVGHTDAVNKVVVTPDEKKAISGSDDYTLIVWNLETGEKLHTLQGHTQRINALIVTGDGQQVISAASDNTLKIWDLENGRELHTLRRKKQSQIQLRQSWRDFQEGISQLPQALFNFQLKFFESVQLRQFQKRGFDLINRINALERVKVTDVALIPDGKRVISSSGDHTLTVWNLEDGTEQLTLYGHKDRVNAVVVTPDGRRAISAAGYIYDYTLKVWDLENGTELYTLSSHNARINAVAVTPDGKLAVSASDDNTLKVWNLEEGIELHTLFGHTDRVNAVAVTLDGERAISTSSDGTLHVWDLKIGQVIARFNTDEGLQACTVTSDGQKIVAGSTLGRVHCLQFIEGESSSKAVFNSNSQKTENLYQKQKILMPNDISGVMVEMGKQVLIINFEITKNILRQKDISSSIQLCEQGLQYVQQSFLNLGFGDEYNPVWTKQYPWGQLQLFKGLCLLNYLQEDSAPKIEQAINAFTDALAVFPPDNEISLPESAATQCYLGLAYTKRVRGNLSQNQERAIEAFELALALLKRKKFTIRRPVTTLAGVTFRFPKRQVQSELGTLYLKRTQGDRSENLERAIAYFETVRRVPVFPFYKSFKEHAFVLTQLGEAYYERRQGDPSDNLKRAFWAFSVASIIYIFQNSHLELANIHKKLGLLFLKLPLNDSNMQQAIYHFKSALGILNRYENSQTIIKQWAEIQNYLGIAYYQKYKQIIRNELANEPHKLEEQSQYLELALEVFEAVIKADIRETLPQEWSKAQTNLGKIYSIRLKGEDSDNREQAIAAYQEALKIFNPQQFPQEWANTQNLLGLAYYYRVQGEFPENLEKAIESFRASLTIFNSQKFTQEWLAAQNNLGVAFLKYFEDERADKLERAIEAFEAIDSFFSQVNYKEFLDEWLLTKYHLAVTYQKQMQEEPSERLKLALKAIDAILAEFIPEYIPDEWLGG